MLLTSVVLTIKAWWVKAKPRVKTSAAEKAKQDPFQIKMV